MRNGGIIRVDPYFQAVFVERRSAETLGAAELDWLAANTPCEHCARLEPKDRAVCFSWDALSAKYEDELPSDGTGMLGLAGATPPPPPPPPPPPQQQQQQQQRRQQHWQHRASAAAAGAERSHSLHLLHRNGSAAMRLRLGDAEKKESGKWTAMLKVSRCPS